ncbi:hypothetical protein AQ490_10105 [Wenjunlia vitaminophila]|uniref:Uncharacterized protein n=1 Tax=Wenjunlia vitaminophila TaxID=76728 RepID=A0A0T6LM55_WENVI|nr:hypothetical protein [Wenjunlia vitaminophila]KRV47096.1 hypothetical protein AQ490_10105 [Wenjunlia vitaminophila]
MSDPTEPDEPFEADQETEPGESDIEAPEADAAEQRAEVRQHTDHLPPSDERTPEAAEADALDQRAVVELDEDDYRE